MKESNSQLKCIYREMSKLIYKINPQKNFIDLCSGEFVRKNRDKCIIIHNNDIFPLKGIFSIKDLQKGEEKLEIFLIELEDIYDKSYMFQFCTSLEEYSLFEGNNNEFQKINQKKEKETYTDENSFYFTGRNYTKNKTTGGNNSLFEFYQDLSFLPNMNKLKWNTNIFTNLSHMFSHCTSLISLPYLSKWNTDKVIDMSSMFEGCISLKSLPEIFKLKKNNYVTNMAKMFLNCSSLVSLPNDISEWDTSKVTDMKQMFCECSSLKSLPDISNWNTENLTDMMKMFQGCESLVVLPDLSK